MTDITKFKQVAEITIWKAKEGESWELWIDNVCYECKTFQDLLRRISYLKGG